MCQNRLMVWRNSVCLKEAKRAILLQRILRRELVSDFEDYDEDEERKFDTRIEKAMKGQD